MKKSPEERLVKAVKAFEDRQHFRTATANRLRQYGLNVSPLLKAVKDLEKDAKKKIEKDLVDKVQICAKLAQLKGFGKLISAKLFRWLYPMEKWHGVRSLWHYAGLIPKEERKHKYCHQLHALLRWIGMLQIQHKGYYYPAYQKLLKKISEKHPDWTTMRKSPKGKTKAENAAFTRMVKQILKDVYLNWKTTVPNAQCVK